MKLLSPRSTAPIEFGAGAVRDAANASSTMNDTKVPPGRVAPHRHHLRLRASRTAGFIGTPWAVRAPRPLQFQPSEPRQHHAPVVGVESAVHLALVELEADRLLRAALAKLRVPGAVSEKIGERPVLVAQFLREHRGGGLAQPRVARGVFEPRQQS